MTKRTCSVDGCHRAHHARGWCPTHLMRWRKTGDPLGLLATEPGLPLRTLKDWLANRDRGECWPWEFGRVSGGYGMVYDPTRRKRLMAHRFAYELDHGRELQFDGCHRCDNPPCVNPDHIFDGTDKVNQIDAARKGRKASKLNPEQVLAIRKDPRTVYAIADDYGVTFSHVATIKRREVWAWLPDAG